MPVEPKVLLTDEALDRMAREWFTEARMRQREELRAARQSVADRRPASDADSGGLVDWLFGDTGDDGACHDSDGDD